MAKKTLKEGDLVIFYIPPHWANKPRPTQLVELAEDLIEKKMTVKFVESEKPVYGYLYEKTGGSDDARILERIALHPLRNETRNDNNVFLNAYFTGEALKSTLESILDYKPGEKIDNLPRMSANVLVEELVDKYGADNILILSDMDPALQKAAKNNKIKDSNRLDQQNHAILLDKNNEALNTQLKKAVLAKVLGGRWENISHIDLGGKNTLQGVIPTLDNLKITERSTINEVKEKIYEIILKNKIKCSDIQTEFVNKNYVGVIGSDAIKCVKDINKVIYVYAHMKNPIIAKHILNKIKSNDCDYNDKIFIFCGINATGSYNAMHLAYLADADGITTSGAGTSGEFVYLHKNADAKSNLLSLPIEGHNEQEAITEALCLHPATKEYMVTLASKELLEDGGKIDELVRRKAITGSDHVITYGKFITALRDKNTYVNQAHDILFGHVKLDGDALKYHSIQQGMYNDANLKGTRKYLKLIFQLFNYLTTAPKPFPLAIKFKEGLTGIEFSSIDEVNDFFGDTEEMKNILGLTDKKKVDSLPLINDVKELIKSWPLYSEDEGKENFIKLKDKLGHYMTTGF